MSVTTVEFDRATQSLDALNAAAYRLLGFATCKIDLLDGKYIVSITPIASQKAGDDLGQHFTTIVTDENVRLQIAQRTEPVRNLILALAFGSLAHHSSEETS